MLQELRPTDPRLIGPYRLVGQLGDGGMGRVFLGRSAGGRPVAVKVIRSDLAADPDFRARFRREVAAARRVNGLFTAMVVDADVDAPEPWLATAYVAGPSLAEAVRQQGPLPVNSVLALAAGLAESLAAIHAAGVVHRDLKPSNVLLGPDGPCVIDFGISRAVEQTSLTRVGFVIGSPGFMSPEQAEGHEVGPASDIFSLGAVLAFAAIADSPFGSGSTAALVYRIVYSPPNLAGVPDEIRPRLERCLAKDPAQRPTASELLAELEVAEPETGWLPEPFTRAFSDAQAQRAERPTPPVVAAPADADLTVTGESVPVVPRPESAPGQAGAAAPDPEAEAASPEAEAAAPDLEGRAVPLEAAAAAAAALAVASDAETVLPGAETVLPRAETAQPRAEAVAAKRETVAPSAEAVHLEPSTIPPVGDATSAEAETVAKAIPLAAAVPLAGEDLPRKPRRRPARSIALASAAAVLVIASVGIGLALTGSNHPSSSHQGALVAASSFCVASGLSSRSASGRSEVSVRAQDLAAFGGPVVPAARGAAHDPGRDHAGADDAGDSALHGQVDTQAHAEAEPQADSAADGAQRQCQRRQPALLRERRPGCLKRRDTGQLHLCRSQLGHHTDRRDRLERCRLWRDDPRAGRGIHGQHRRR